MKFGVFDLNDSSGLRVADQYQMKFELASLYEATGFHIYQVSEHHGTPLSTAPPPGVFLAAPSQRTSKLRLGPLVYLLPAYEPLRLIEEIAMLDHLSKGRLEFGVGRGASPYEMGFFGAAADDVQPMYPEAFDIIRTALATGSLHHEGQYWRYHNIDLSIAPLQMPCPQMWVVVNSGFAVVCSAETVRDTLERQVEISGANFIGSNFVFGDLSFEEGSRSIRLFAEHVMPALRKTVNSEAALA